MSDSDEARVMRDLYNARHWSADYEVAKRIYAAVDHVLARVRELEGRRAGSPGPATRITDFSGGTSATAAEIETLRRSVCDISNDAAGRLKRLERGYVATMHYIGTQNRLVERAGILGHAPGDNLAAFQDMIAESVATSLRFATVMEEVLAAVVADGAPGDYDFVGGPVNPEPEPPVEAA